MAFEYGCHVLCLLFFSTFIRAGMGMIVVDDTNPQIVFSNSGPSWWGANYHNGQGNLIGGHSRYDLSKLPYGFTWHEVLGDGAWASMTFTGTRVNLTGTIRHSGEPTRVDFYIDGQYMTRFENIPEVTNSASGDIYLLYTMADFDNLSPAEHTLKAVSVGADSLFVVDFMAYEPSTAVPVSSTSVSSNSSALSTSSSTVSTTQAFSSVSTSLSTSPSSFSSSQSAHSTSSIAVDTSQPLAAEMDVPASDSHVSYWPSGAWSPYSDARRAISCLEGTMSSSTAGSYLTYNFTGTTIQAYTVSSSIGGNYSVSIDGQNQGTFTTYDASGDPSNCSSRPVYSTTGLSNTPHTLVLTAQDHPSGSTQNTIQFVGFRVSSSIVGVPSSSTSASGPNVGAIVGGVIGGSLGIVLIILSIVLCLRRQRKVEEALVAEALGTPTSSSMENDPFTSAIHEKRHVQGQGFIPNESATSISTTSPRSQVMVQQSSSELIMPIAPIITIGAPEIDDNDASTERLTYYTLPSYHENVMQRPAARNLSEADVEAISRRLRQVMRNQATLSGGNPDELMPPRELIDHLVQAYLEPRAL